MAAPEQAVLKVAAGIVRKGEQILIARRASGHLAGHWEFPGGKLEPDETPGEALQREILEELGIEIKVGEVRVRHRTHGERRELELIFIDARYQRGVPTLTDHDAIEWVTPAELCGYRFAPADQKVATALRQDHLQTRP